MTIISIVRLQSLIAHGWDSPNATRVKLDVAVGSTVEVNVGIICACMPSFRSVIIRIFPSLIWSSDKESKHDFAERNLGFGTTSQSMAERASNVPLPTRPGVIALHITYAVEFGTRGAKSDEQFLIKISGPGS